MSHPVEKGVEVAAAGTVVAVVVGWLPTIAVSLSILYYLFKIYETKTVQRWLDRLRRPDF